MSGRQRGREQRSGAKWTLLMEWVGRITAISGLAASLLGGAVWWIDHSRHQEERRQQMALAQAEAEGGRYQEAVETWGEILKRDPTDAAALDGQLNAVLLWVENFHVISGEGQNPAELAAHALDFIFPVLEAGMSRASGRRAADIQAHVGWAHWLNQHLAAAEFGAEAEENLRGALRRDPGNVYAHGMLGNWQLQNRGNFEEAVEHLHRAVATGRARALVRRLQFGGLIGLNQPGARAEMMRVANEMRRGGEILDAQWRHRAVGYCCDPVVNTHPELVESLSAVAPDDAWQTYLWLDAGESSHAGGEDRALVHRYIQANLLAISGRKEEARQQFRQLQKEAKLGHYSAGAAFPAMPDTPSAATDEQRQ